MLALTRPLRSSDLVGLSLTNLRCIPEGAIFSPTKLAKQSCAKRPIKEFFPMFPDNLNLCPVNTLKVYIEWAKASRGSENSVFLTAVGKHHPATAATIARWIKTGLSKAGIDTSIFKVHSI